MGETIGLVILIMGSCFLYGIITEVVDKIHNRTRKTKAKEQDIVLEPKGGIKSSDIPPRIIR
jgi:hypothetical protein